MRVSPEKGPSGFTLIELLLVVAIIGTAAGLALPRLRGAFERSALENFAKDVYYTGLYLQSRAVIERKIYCLETDPAQTKFQAAYRQDNELKVVSGRFFTLPKAPRGLSVAVENRDIYFYPDGSMDEAWIKFENADKDGVLLKFHNSGGQIEIE